MSKKDAERLLSDLRSNTALKDKLKATGSEHFEKTARDAGYDVSRKDFAEAIKEHVAQADLAGPKGFAVADGIVSGVSGGISSTVSGVVSGIA